MSLKQLNRFRFIPFALLASVVGLVAACSEEAASAADAQQCTVGDKTYAVGERVVVVDAECSCLADGELGDCKPLQPNPPSGCTVGDKTYAAGEWIEDADGCNTCLCGASGSVTACTRMACPLAGCVYDGRGYAVGDEFDAADGCNACSCTEKGVTCTEKSCAMPPACLVEGKVYWAGQTVPVGEGTCSCSEQGTLLCMGLARGCEFGDATFATGAVISIDGRACLCLEDGLIGQCTGAVKGCSAGDEEYAAGETYLTESHVCRCLEDGASACATRATECAVNGEKYQVGDVISGDDDSISCVCLEGGIVGQCTGAKKP
jgi:hypothetical protein